MPASLKVFLRGFVCISFCFFSLITALIYPVSRTRLINLVFPFILKKKLS